MLNNLHGQRLISNRGSAANADVTSWTRDMARGARAVARFVGFRIALLLAQAGQELFPGAPWHRHRSCATSATSVRSGQEEPVTWLSASNRQVWAWEPGIAHQEGASRFLR